MNDRPTELESEPQLMCIPRWLSTGIPLFAQSIGCHLVLRRVSSIHPTFLPSRAGPESCPDAGFYFGTM